MTEKPVEYVVGVLIPGTSNPFLHMTICVIQEERWSDHVVKEVEALAAAVLPLPVTFGECALFGPDKNVPVRLMQVIDPKSKALLDAFYRDHFTPLKGEEDRLTQNFHVSIKKIPNEANALSPMTLPVMFLKVVGSPSYLWKSDCYVCI